MFDKDFYPTPPEIIDLMINDFDLRGKIVLEPSAGKGNIVDRLIQAGAEVIGSEKHPDLRHIVSRKCKIIAEDFLTVTSSQISHIHFIIMNPPFSADANHINHAFDIAPPGCRIVALCNKSSIENPYTTARKQLVRTIDNYGDHSVIDGAFVSAERKTNVSVALIRLQKPGASYDTEFDGFFMDDDPEHDQVAGIISYNVIHDLVNRYVAAIKLYDEQLSTGLKMNSLLKEFYGEELCFTCTENGQSKLRNQFKKDMQKAGWNFIFEKMNMQKYATKGLMEDINKFVEQQQNIPFTVKNIYRMLEIVAGTNEQRMDKAIVEVFEQITRHHADNSYNIEGWKTNSHYLVTRKFIIPNMCWQDQRWHKGESKIQTYGHYWDFIEDLNKALCFITGSRYEAIGTLRDHIRYPYKTITSDKIYYHDTYQGHVDKKDQFYKEGIQYKMMHTEPVYGQWFEWGYFRVKAFKKGSMHFEFKDPELWARFNQRIAKIKGYQLFEGKQQTAYQKRQTGRGKKEAAYNFA